MSKVSIIVPVFNEEKNIGKALDALLKTVKGKGFEVIVVDDGSTDGTVHEIKKRNVKLLKHPYNKGYGAALKTGIRNSKGKILATMDSDGQHNPKDLLALLKFLPKYDMVVGARGKSSHVPLFRRPAKFLLSLTANYLVERKIPDLNSGMRAMKREVAERFMSLLPDSFSYSTTITLCCFKSGLNVKYVPIKVVKRGGKSKIHPLKDSFRFLMLILRTVMLFSPLKVFLPISLFLFVIGFWFLISGLIFYNDISDGTVFIVLTSILVFFFGLIADQISLTRREFSTSIEKNKRREN